MSSAFSNAPTFTNDELDAFASALSRTPGDPATAASIVCPTEPGRAMMLIPYATSAYVLAKAREVIEDEGWIKRIPSRDELAFQVLQATNEKDANGHMQPFRLRLDGFRLFAEVMGYISKPGVTLNQNNVTNKVMIVQDGGTDEAWETKLVEQQRALTAHATVN